MDYKVLYYSTGGTGKRVAEKISKGLKCDLQELKKGETEKNVKLKDDQEIILVCPIKAARIAKPVRIYLETATKSKTHLVVQSAYTNYKKTEGFASATSISKKQKNEDMEIGELLKTLR